MVVLLDKVIVMVVVMVLVSPLPQQAILALPPALPQLQLVVACM